MIKMDTIKIKAPATVANLVCGFDVLGMCLHEPYDVLELTLLNERKVVIEVRGDFTLPLQPELNTAGVPLLEIVNTFPREIGFELIIHKNIKPGSGLGSSAASAAGAVVAANHLLQHHYSTDQLIQFAMSGEKLVSGVKHADNVAPCILGGITIIRSIFPLDIVSITAPPLYVAVVHPQIEIRTSDARQILKSEVQFKDAIKQWGNVAGLVAGFLKEDYGLIGRSLEDFLIEPSRSVLIPGYPDVKKKSLQAGALGGGISGSGPSLFMLCKDEHTARDVEVVMKDVYQAIGLDHYTYTTSLNYEGCSIIA